MGPKGTHGLVVSRGREVGYLVSTTNSNSARRSANLQSTKERVARVSIAAIATLIALKIAAAILTGSIGILADAVHSLIDLTGAIIGYFGVKVAGKPADEKHGFGHGRAEDIAAALIASLIFLAAGIIAYQSILRLVSGSFVEMLDAGILATMAAIAINVTVSRFVFRIAREADSLALEATGRDLMADVLSSVAVLVGLIAVRITGQAALDPIAALIVVVFIVRAAMVTLRKATAALMDTKLPDREEKAIRDVLASDTNIANYHGLRTRKAGSQRHIVVHIVVLRDKTVEEGHAIAEEAEDRIRVLFPGAGVTIHVEPCTPDCAECPAPCDGPPGHP